MDTMKYATFRYGTAEVDNGFNTIGIFTSEDAKIFLGRKPGTSYNI